ncbi:Hypothetical protein SRAE_1000098600 [Strongyloides ratti]|uniref:Ubiquitin-like domain-containing protein n=1 Tax=Strongyloides ratti TaxID=34506 RepID=A0A090KZ88_STRRB|nr:Hypothetical protein SRAE_1000098600 [Strongyloides ratti]CEF62716.1 Hypothetical protein SRAE_1000098600 [Strongyloides ratti]
MASRVESSSSDNREKIQIMHKKVAKNHKSRTDIKKESLALVLKLRQASMERKNGVIDNETKVTKRLEKPEEKNLRIYKALYATPYDDPNLKEKRLSSLSNQSVAGSSDSNKEPIDFFKSIIQSNNPKNKKINDNKENNSVKIDTSKKEKSKGTDRSLESPSLHSISSNSVTKNSQTKNKLKNVNSISSEKRRKKFALPPSNNNSSSAKLIILKEDKQKNVNKLIPKTVHSLTSQSLTSSQKQLPSIKNEFSSKSNNLKNDISSAKMISQPEQYIDSVIKKLNAEKSNNNITYIRFTCRNAFTKKIQFKFMHRQDVNLKVLKARLKGKFNFSGHLFYNGKELIGDKKMLSEFSLPLDCELDIVPQIISGDYSRQQYTQMSRKLDEKKEFVKNIRQIIGGLDCSEKIDVTTKKTIANFETMNDEQRKKFESDMKEKIKKLKEKRDTKRRTKKSYFSTPTINRGNEKNDKLSNVLSSEKATNKSKK